MAEMASHWWWRPGWRPGRRMVAWHVTFEDQPRARRLAEAAHARLAGLPGLDPVPVRWLHLTVQDVGFGDEVSDDDLAAVTGAVRARLARLPPVPVTLGPARVVSEGIVCDASPGHALTPARDAIRAAIAGVRGPSLVAGGPQWWPHVSLGYANASGPSAPVEAAFDGADLVAPVTVRAIRLIRLGRDQRCYQWETLASVPLGASPG